MSIPRRIAVAFAVALVAFALWRVIDKASVEVRSTAKLDREIAVHAPLDAVYAQVTDYRGYASWSPWAGGDTSIMRELEVDGHPGFEWKGPDGKVGTVSFVKRNDEERWVDYVESSGAGRSRGRVRVAAAADDRAVVDWIIDDAPLLTLAGRRGIGPVTAALDAALARLKARIEPPSPPDAGAPASDDASK